MNAYDNIGIQYYYLRDLEKAKYYHERMWKGKCESNQSKIRQIYESNAKLKKKMKQGLPSGAVTKVSNI